MLVIHACWAPGEKLNLWGEDSDRPPVAPPRRGRPPSKPRPRPHPFACDAADVVKATAETVVLAPDVDRRTESTLMLPSGPNGPEASPGLLRAEDAGVRVATHLAPWVAPAVELDPAEAFELLTARPRGPAFGVSLLFFVEVAKFALELVARGRFVPVLEQRGERWAAVWRPAPVTAADRDRLGLLATAMPAACRTGPSPEGHDPHAVLHHSLAVLVDAGARGCIGVRDLLPPRRGRAPRAVAVQEACRRALAAPEPWIDGDPFELEVLHKTLDEWAYPVERHAASPFRTCFRLTEPVADGAPWRLEILLQATADPSMLVPADAVWHRSAAPPFLAGAIDDPQELLLAELGRALRLCPPLAAALDTATPSIVDLDAHGAYTFLQAAAGALEAAGFGVLVPRWWTSGAARIGTKLRVAYKDEAKVTPASRLGLDSLCTYEWKVAIGTEELTFEELKHLAALKAPLVDMRGRWVELNSDDVAAALRLFERGEHAGETTVGEALRTGLGVAPGPVGLPVADLEAIGKLKELLGAAAAGTVEAIPTPRGFAGELRPYQERGLGWLVFLERLGLGACLADDMGLGKTPTLLALLATERNGRARPRPTLVVCPMSVVGNWEREARRFVPSLDVHVHHGSARLSGRKFHQTARASDVVLTTYALVARDRDLLAGVQWERVVLDEAQNIKNAGTRQTRAVRTLASGKRVALTGTPVENRLSELWSLMEFLNPGLLGPAKSFRERFAVPIERHRDDDAAERLRRITQPFVLRRVKTDKKIIRDLPDKIEMKVFCPLSREQASLYQAVVDDMLDKIEAAQGMGRKGLVLATMLRLKQVCNHPAHFLGDRSSLGDRSGKLQRLEEVLEEVLAEGDKALCFTQFAEFGHILKPYLQARFGCEVPFLHGGTGRKVRDEMVARFQQTSGPPVLLVSLKAGGTGLNLTAATHVIHFDRWWNPAVEDQATDRAFRIGQTRNVQVRKFMCAGTLEERIDELIESKKDLAQRIVSSGESWLTELSTAELREIIALSPSAAAG